MRVGNAAANRPSARSRPLGIAVRGNGLDDAQVRLGQRARLVHAHDVHGRQGLDGVQLLRQRSAARDGRAATAKVTLVSRIRPSGMSVTPAATAVDTAWLVGVFRSQSA